MSLSRLTDRAAVLAAIKEFDHFGEQGFLRRHRFTKARSYDLVFDGKRYPSKAIVGVAYGYQFPKEGTLPAPQFSGGNKTVRRALERLGFEVDVRRNELWNDDELRAAVVAYRQMLEAESAGVPYSKAETRRQLLAGPLSGRNDAAFERRMHNISFVLAERGLPWIAGYKPADHPGNNVRARLERLMAPHWPELAGVSADPDAPIPGLDVFAYDANGDAVVVHTTQRDLGAMKAARAGRPPEARPPAARDVEVGQFTSEHFEVSATPRRVAEQRENKLVLRFRDWLAGLGDRVVARAYRDGAVILRCDLFNATRNQLVEAKAASTRECVRMAVGQLLDYQSLESSKPAMAVLVPCAPSPSILRFLEYAGVAAIWPEGDGFVDSAGGAFTA